MHLPLIWIDWGKLLYRIHFSGKINLFNLRENEELAAHKTVFYTVFCGVLIRDFIAAILYFIICMVFY